MIMKNRVVSSAITDHIPIAIAFVNFGDVGEYYRVILASVYRTRQKNSMSRNTY